MYVLIIFFRPDFVDYFYYRFTTPKAHSLILGASRAAQGIKPEVINNKIGLDAKNKIINHSFAGGPSSFGPNYNKEIKQKLIPDTKDGLFIISVIPWNFSTSNDNINDDSLQFYEVQLNLFVGNLKSSSSNPNFEYLWKYWPNKFSVFEHSFKHVIKYGGILRLHADGWLEVNIAMDSVTVKNRIEKSSLEYEEKSKNLKWSNTRYYFFEEMIKYLKDKGEIYIVRLPVSSNMYNLENKKFPEFDQKMKTFSMKYNIPYINFIHESGNYRTTDTHHLWKEESELISTKISDTIIAYRQNAILLN